MHIGWKMAAHMGVRASREMEVLSHNLANTGTFGFKRELLNVWRLEGPGTPLPGGNPPAHYVEVRGRDFSQGTLHQTGNDTDLALEGPGFFKVETPKGVRYTRNGAFRLDSYNRLVTPEGYPLLGKSGAVSVSSIDRNFKVDLEGGIHLDGTLGDQIAVVEFAHPQALRAEGSHLFAPAPDAGEEMEAKASRVRQGEIEESNADPVGLVVELADLHRRFEAYLKVLDTFAANDRKVMEEVGHVG